MSMTLPVRLLAGVTLCTCAGGAVAAPAATDAVVRIYCRGELGAGFVFGDRRHVLTSLHTVASGRDVEVIFADGTRATGDTVAVDKGNGVALIELAEAAPAEPLVPTDSTPVAGDVVAVVVPTQTLWTEAKDRVPPARVPGAIGAVGEDGLRVAVAIPADAVGAPVLDPEGRLIGMVGGVGPVAPVIRAAHFTSVSRGRAGDSAAAHTEDDYWGEHLLILRGGWLMRADRNGLSQGPRLSIDVLAYDRVGLTARMGVLFGDTPGESPDGLVGAEGVGSVMDVELHGRIGLWATVPLQLVVGLGATQVHWTTTGHVLEDGALVEATRTTDLLRPYLRLGLGVTDTLELGYTLELDPDDPGRSGHRFGLTFGF